MTDNTPDEILMLNVKNGDLAQLSPIFSRYNKAMFNFFIRLGLDRDTSQDLTQNLFYRVIKYRHTYREDSKFKAWIYQMARNLHADHCTELKRTTALFRETDETGYNITDSDEHYNESDFERLDRALDELNDSHREIIVLNRFQGLKYEEISSITGQSVPAIKVAMHRAIKQLRAVYFKHV
jgi:RNA polymerase sigma factor (sigma-70 family)